MSDSTGREQTGAPSDEELMTTVARGDLGAFEHLVLRHQRSAWNAAYRFIGDEAEAEDIAQEAFLQILEAAPRYQPTARFRTYLYRVVTRLCMDHARKKRPVYNSDLPDTPDSAGSPLDLITALERTQAVRQALRGLSSNQRMVVVLRYYEGLAYSEIATVLETTTKAVERLLARARENLEETLGHLLD